MKAVKRRFNSFKQRVKKTYRIWFPKKQKKGVKRIANEIAKVQVRVMQSRHYIKQTIVAIIAIQLFLTPIFTAFYAWNSAQEAQEAKKVAHEMKQRLDDMPDPTYGDMIGTVVGATINGAVGACYWLINYL